MAAPSLGSPLLRAVPVPLSRPATGKEGEPETGGPAHLPLTVALWLEERQAPGLETSADTAPPHSPLLLASQVHLGPVASPKFPGAGKIQFRGDLLWDELHFFPSLCRLGKKYRVLSLSHWQNSRLLPLSPRSGPAPEVKSGPGGSERGRATR